MIIIWFNAIMIKYYCCINIFATDAIWSFEILNLMNVRDSAQQQSLKKCI